MRPAGRRDVRVRDLHAWGWGLRDPGWKQMVQDSRENGKYLRYSRKNVALLDFYDPFLSYAKLLVHA